MARVNECFKNVTAVVWLIIVVLSCQSTEQPKQITPAFYHWKATYDPTSSEKEQLKRAHVDKLYLHFFDVDWDPKSRQPIPKALIRFRQKPLGNVIPVVFITNRTLLNLLPSALPDLAGHITEAIQQLAKSQSMKLQEVQFDCDWSLQTRDRYFRLLTLLKSQLHCQLSATIRLHQIKYTDQTGIPPVGRGMLMLYNVADWKRADTRNSIYDAKIADSYLSYLSTYPLPLDLVMPLFRWTVVYRNSRFLTFLNNVDRSTLAKTNFLTAQSDSSRFIANRDTSAFGFSIRPGDLFRAEAVSASVLQAEKKKVLNQISNPSITFALYHLDSIVLSSYSRETIQTLLRPLP